MIFTKLHCFLYLTCLVAICSTKRFSTPIGIDSEAVQIIRRKVGDSMHEFDFPESALKVLEGLDKSCAVLSVIGPYHSGKSFLMSQIIGETKAFPIGSSVRPETQGLWFWNNPVTTPSGKCVYLIDTEGLWATNVPDRYDLELLTMVLSISTHILYNVQGMPNVRDMNSFESLVRRAQEFRVIGHNVSKSYLSADQLHMPNLTWVAQNFGADSSRNTDQGWQGWLQELLDDQRSRNDGHGLVDVFDNISLQTAFFPVRDRDDLANLGDCDDSRLTDDYKDSIDKLVAHLDDVISTNSVKDLMTGADMAQELKIVLKAADMKLTPKVYSSWTNYVQLRVANAATYCRDLFNDAFSQLKEVEVPTTLEEMTSVIGNKTNELKEAFCQQVLDADSCKKEVHRVESFVNSRKDDILEGHGHRITSYVNDKYKAAKDSLKQAADDLESKFPSTKDELKTAFDEQTNAVKTGFDSSVEKYHQAKDSISDFVKDVSDAFTSLTGKNEKSIQQKAKEALEEAQASFDTAVSGIKSPQIKKDVESALEKARSEANQQYNEAVGKFQDTSESVKNYLDDLTTYMTDKSSEFLKTNSDNIGSSARNVLKNANATAHQAVHQTLPLGPSSLNLYIDDEIAKLRKTLDTDSTLAKFAQEPECQEVMKLKDEVLQSLRQKIIEDDRVAYVRRVEQPLKRAAQDLRERADDMDTFPLQQFKYIMLRMEIDEIVESHLGDSDLADGIGAKAKKDFLSPESPYTQDFLPDIWRDFCWNVAFTVLSGALAIVVFAMVMNSPNNEQDDGTDADIEEISTQQNSKAANTRQEDGEEEDDDEDAATDV